MSSPTAKHPSSALGRLNPNVAGLERSATLAINERADRLRRQGKKVYKLGLGQSPFPVPEKVVHALRRHAEKKQYLPVQGLPALREAVAEFHWLKDRVETHGDLILVGPGSKELVFLAQLAFRGDILIPTPSWVSYVPQARILGHTPQVVPVSFEDRWRLSAERLDETLSELAPGERRLLILNYPNNPAGNSYPEAELRALAEVARRHDLVILSDEIYAQLEYSGNHTSIARYYPEGTIISSGLSKWCGAGGWRLGTFAFPRALDWLLEAMSSVASETFTAVSTPIQYAAVAAFEGGVAIETYLANARRILAALGLECAALLAGAGVRVHPPTGAFYLFADFGPFAEKLARRGIRGGASLCDRLLEDTGVALLPGEPFGRPAEELTARISFVNFDGGRALRKSLEIPLEEQLTPAFLEEHCGETLRAMRLMATWLD